MSTGSTVRVQSTECWGAHDTRFVARVWLQRARADLAEKRALDYSEQSGRRTAQIGYKSRQSLVGAD